MVKESACDSGDMGLMPRLERFPGGGNGNSLQCSCLENFRTEEPGGLQPMGSQSRTRFNDLTIARAHCSSFFHVASSGPFLSPLI